MREKYLRSRFAVDSRFSLQKTRGRWREEEVDEEERETVQFVARRKGTVFENSHFFTSAFHFSVCHRNGTERNETDEKSRAQTSNPKSGEQTEPSALLVAANVMRQVRVPSFTPFKTSDLNSQKEPANVFIRSFVRSFLFRCRRLHTYVRSLIHSFIHFNSVRRNCTRDRQTGRQPDIRARST